MRPVFAIISCGWLLTACVSPTPAPQRLPTRAPSATPTATPPDISAVDYYREGLGRQQAGDIEGAVQYLTWAIQRDPGLVEAYVARSSVHLAQGDLEQALSDADAALELEPSARSYVLRGEALRMMGRFEEALETFDGALASDPGLRDETFQSRWSAARAAGDLDCLSTLSGEYAGTHADDALRHYYRARAALASGLPTEAVEALVEGIAETVDAPAVLWYLLGQAYSEIEAWPEAVTSLEAARTSVEAGDTSLALDTARPVADLFAALGRAYLGAGRCADAETMLAYAISIGAPSAEHLPALREAQDCQMPVPTASPTPSTG